MGGLCSRLCGDSGNSKHTGLSVECTGNSCSLTPAHRQQQQQQQQTGQQQTGQYSWDRRPKMDPTMFTVENKENEVVHRMPDSTGGNQFIIQNCKNSHIYILDATQTVTVDDCTDCVIYLGPIKSSIFMRDCTGCVVMTACQQFRLRDCKQLTVLLCCTTQPIIESSTGIQFSCFSLYYPQLKDQFERAGLSIYNNNWGNIHDFTPVTNEKNFTLLSTDNARVDELMRFTQLCTVLDGLTTSSSVVPRTLGSNRKPASLSSCLVLFSASDGDVITTFISRMSTQEGEVMLVQTRQLRLTSSDVQRVFGTDRYNSSMQSGIEVVVLEYCGGTDICQLCRDVLMTSQQQQQQQQQQLLPHVSESCERAVREIEAFNDLATLQLSI